MGERVIVTGPPGAGIEERHLVRGPTADVDKLADQIVERIRAGGFLVEDSVAF